MSDSWKLTLPCTRAEAEVLDDNIEPLAILEPSPALMTSEINAREPEKWRLDVYFQDKPANDIILALQALVPSAAGIEPQLVRLDDEDWVSLSQQGLEPIREGRFFVHTPVHRDNIPDDAIAFEIDASRAFGTGQHETTAGCLAMLDRAKSENLHFTNICDLGTGTGLLAFASLALWPEAKATASDIDPLAIEIAGENARINNVDLGKSSGQLELIVADGLDNQCLIYRAPYDLIVANILAKPLIDLAEPIANTVTPGGTIILAGLQKKQANRVLEAYLRASFQLVHRIERNDWTILSLQKRPSP